MRYKLPDIMDLIGGGTPKTSKQEYWGGDIPVSYTHLDVYKRQSCVLRSLPLPLIKSAIRGLRSLRSDKVATPQMCIRDSTLLHMMGGLDTPTSGTVIVRGEELAKKNDEQLKMCIRDRQ